MNSTPHILIVDDELSVREMTTILMRRQGYTVTSAGSGDQALRLLKAGNRYDLVITDLAMDQGNGMTVLSAVKERDEECPVILITAFGTTDTAVEAMKRGAFDYINKPFNVDEFKIVAANALRQHSLARENQQLKAQLQGQTTHGITGKSKAIQEIAALCKKIAPTPASVLITGESGTGKEVVARAIHHLSPDHRAPFVAINCGALPEPLMESELFGHQKGAFTGASADTPGLLQQAHGGIVFLDEIGEMPLPLQVKLLRVLQEKTVRPVGGTTEHPVQFRIIAATNQDLDTLVDAGQFRSDLFYRLNVIDIHIPPLRERIEDVEPLTNALLRDLATQMDRPVPRVSGDMNRILMDYAFPGNVRELKNILERAMALCSGDTLTADALPRALQPGRGTPCPLQTNIGPDGIDLDRELIRFERGLIDAALDRTDGVQAAAAKLLNISVRSLRYRLQKPEESPPDSQ